MTSWSPYGQWLLTLNGVAIGAQTGVGIINITGLEDSAEVRSSDTQLPQRHGDSAGQSFMSSRVITVECDGQTSDADQLNALRQAFVLCQPAELTVENIAGLPKLWFQGEVRKSRLPMDRMAALGALQPSFQFYCPDPLRYSAEETILNLDLREQVGNHTLYAAARPYASPVPYAGVTTPTVYLTPPLTPPITPSGRTGLSVYLTALNKGFYATAPIIRVFGPCPPFSLLQATTNRMWSYKASIDSGDFLEVDMQEHTVLLNGTASRRQFKRGVWWDLPQGSNSVSFLPSAPAVGARLEVRFRSAY